MNSWPTSWVIALTVIPLAVLYGLLVWQRKWVYRFAEFLVEVKAELRRVNWPPRKEVVGTTSVVIVTVFFFGIFLSLVDILVTYGRTALFRAAGIGQ
jgi:preprotein translocase subunit SecE